MANLSEPRANQYGGESSEFSYEMVEKPDHLQDSATPQASKVEQHDKNPVHAPTASNSVDKSINQIGQNGGNIANGTRHRTLSAEVVARGDGSKVLYQYSHHMQVPYVGNQGDSTSALEAMKRARTPRDLQVYQWLGGLHRDENARRVDVPVTLGALDTGTISPTSDKRKKDDAEDHLSDSALRGLGAWM